MTARESYFNVISDEIFKIHIYRRPDAISAYPDKKFGDRYDYP